MDLLKEKIQLKPQQNNNKNHPKKSTNLPKVVYNSDQLMLCAGKAHGHAYVNLNDAKKYWYYMAWHCAFIATMYNSQNKQFNWHNWMKKTNDCLEHMRLAIIRDFEKTVPKINRGNF